MNDGPTAAAIQEGTVEALVDQVRELLRSEDAREQSFHTRRATVAGFVGLIVPVSIATAADVFTPSVAEPWRWIAAGLLVAMLASLLLTTYSVVHGVLTPGESLNFSVGEVHRYPTRAFVTQSRVQAQGRILTGLVEILAKDRDRVARKARKLRAAYRTLAASVVLLATLGIIAGLHAQRLIRWRHTSCPLRTEEPRCMRSPSATRL